MAPELTALKVLVDHVRAEQDVALESRGKPRIAETLLAVRSRRMRRMQTRARTVRVAATLAVLVAIAFVIGLPRALRRGGQEGAALAFRVDASTLGTLGARIGAEGHPTAIAFSDGSRIDVRSGAHVTVTAVGERSARIVLEQGSVLTHVVPREGNAWTLQAGSFEIHVRGTRFDTEWIPSEQHLRIAMFEGHVSVTGPCLAAPQELKAGTATDVRCPDLGGAERASPTTAPAARPTVTQLAPRREHALVPALEIAPALDVAAPAASAATEPAVALETPESLLARANAYRREGDAAAAERTYEQIRSAFPHTESAARATFLLARLFAETNRGARAAVLFDRYLQSSPLGVFAEESSGRLIELAQARGDHDEAERRARAHLIRYSRGPYSDVARAVLLP